MKICRFCSPFSVRRTRHIRLDNTRLVSENNEEKQFSDGKWRSISFNGFVFLCSIISPVFAHIHKHIRHTEIASPQPKLRCHARHKITFCRRCTAVVGRCHNKYAYDNASNCRQRARKCHKITFFVNDFDWRWRRWRRRRTTEKTGKNWNDE